MALVLPYHTSHHDSLPIPVLALEGATSYWASAVANPSGHMSHLGARGTGWTVVAPAGSARLVSLRLGPTRRPWRVQGGRPPDGISVPRCGLSRPAEGAARDERHHDRPGHRQDGLFTNGNFCLTRRGQLVLPQYRARSGADRERLEAGGAVPGGPRLLGVGHATAAVGGPPAAGGPSGGAAAAGQDLSAAPAGHHRTPRQVRSPGRPVGRRGGEPSCE